MTNTHSKAAMFKRIETQAVLPDGRKVISTRSYPLGVSKDEYDAIDTALVAAFGNHGSRTVGTFMDGETATRGK